MARDEELGFWDVMNTKGREAFEEGIFNLFSENRGLGAAFSIAPEVVRQPVRETVGETLEFLGEAASDVIQEPASALVMFGNMLNSDIADAQGMSVSDRWFNAWHAANKEVAGDKAYSLGAAIALAFGTGDILDAEARERFMDTPQFQVSSGILDGIKQIFLDFDKFVPPAVGALDRATAGRTRALREAGQTGGSAIRHLRTLEGTFNNVVLDPFAAPGRVYAATRELLESGDVGRALERFGEMSEKSQIVRARARSQGITPMESLLRTYAGTPRFSEIANHLEFHDMVDARLLDAEEDVRFDLVMGLEQEVSLLSDDIDSIDATIRQAEAEDDFIKGILREGLGTADGPPRAPLPRMLAAGRNVANLLEKILDSENAIDFRPERMKNHIARLTSDGEINVWQARDLMEDVDFVFAALTQWSASSSRTGLADIALMRMMADTFQPIGEHVGDGGYLYRGIREPTGYDYDRASRISTARGGDALTHEEMVPGFQFNMGMAAASEAQDIADGFGDWMRLKIVNDGSVRGVAMPNRYEKEWMIHGRFEVVQKLQESAPYPFLSKMIKVDGWSLNQLMDYVDEMDLHDNVYSATLRRVEEDSTSGFELWQIELTLLDADGSPGVYRSINVEKDDFDARYMINLMNNADYRFVEDGSKGGTVYEVKPIGPTDNFFHPKLEKYMKANEQLGIARQKAHQANRQIEAIRSVSMQRPDMTVTDVVKQEISRSLEDVDADELLVRLRELESNYDVSIIGIGPNGIIGLRRGDTLEAEIVDDLAPHVTSFQDKILGRIKVRLDYNGKMEIVEGRDELLDILASRVKDPDEPFEAAARMAIHSEAIDRVATYIAERHFRNHPRRELVGRLVASAPTRESRVAVMQVLAGNQRAIQALRNEIKSAHAINKAARERNELLERRDKLRDAIAVEGRIGSGLIASIRGNTEGSIDPFDPKVHELEVARRVADKLDEEERAIVDRLQHLEHEINEYLTDEGPLRTYLDFAHREAAELILKRPSDDQARAIIRDTQRRMIAGTMVLDNKETVLEPLQIRRTSNWIRDKSEKVKEAIVSGVLNEEVSSENIRRFSEGIAYNYRHTMWGAPIRLIVSPMVSKSSPLVSLTDPRIANDNIQRFLDEAGYTKDEALRLVNEFDQIPIRDLEGRKQKLAEIRSDAIIKVVNEMAYDPAQAARALNNTMKAMGLDFEFPVGDFLNRSPKQQAQLLEYQTVSAVVDASDIDGSIERLRRLAKRAGLEDSIDFDSIVDAPTIRRLAHHVSKNVYGDLLTELDPVDVIAAASRNDLVLQNIVKGTKDSGFINVDGRMTFAGVQLGEDVGLLPNISQLRSDIKRWRRLGRMADSIGASGELAQSVHRVGGATRDMFDTLNYYQKLNLILRPSWAPRAIGLDEGLRALVISEGMSGLGNWGRGMTSITAKMNRNFNDRLIRHFGEQRGGQLADGLATGIGAFIGGGLAGPVGAVVGGAAGAGVNKVTKNLRTMEQLGWDREWLETSIGKVEVNNVVHGDSGRRAIDRLGYANELDQSIRLRNRDIQKIFDTEELKRWNSIPASAGEPHIDRWHHLLNKTARESVIIQKILRESDTDEIVRWLEDEFEGRELVRQMPIQASSPWQWVDDNRNLIAQLTSGNDELLLKLMNGETITKAELRAIPLPARPQTLSLGEVEFAFLGNDKVSSIMRRTVDKAVNAMIEVPGLHFSRVPMLDALYKKRLRTLIDLRAEQGLYEDGLIPHTDILEMQSKAKEWAVNQARTMSYEFMARNQFMHYMRFIAPFLPAAWEASRTWSRLAVHEPYRVMQLVSVYQDLTELPYVREREDGEKIIDLPIPEFASEALQRGRWFNDFAASSDAVSIPIDSLNLVLQGDFFTGTFVRMTASQILKHKPELEESLEWALPYGPTENIMDGVLGSLPRNVIRRLTGDESDDRWMRTYLGIARIHATEVALGLREYDPNNAQAYYDGITEATRDFYNLQILSNLGSPTPLLPRTPFDYWIDVVNNLKDQHGGEWRDAFYENYMQEFIEFSRAMNPEANRMSAMRAIETLGLGITQGILPPTKAGLEVQKNFGDFIARHPEWASFLVGEDPANDAMTEFQKSIYNNQFGQTLVPGSGEPIRELRAPDDFFKTPEVRLGWQEYIDAMEYIDNQRVQRGLANLNLKEAEDLANLKRFATQQIADMYPEWWQEFNVTDRLAQDRKISGARDLANDPRLGGRGDVRAVGMWLTLYDDMRRRLLDRGGAKTLSAESNYDLQRLYQQNITELANTYPAFGPVYYRYFDNIEIRAGNG